MFFSLDVRNHETAIGFFGALKVRQSRMTTFIKTKLKKSDIRRIFTNIE